MIDCTVYNTTEIIGKKWALMIILSIYKSNNKKRFSEIKKELTKVTPKILSLRLKELEKSNIIKKEIDNSKVPIIVYYSLTNSGKDLIKIIQDIKSWGLKWNQKSKYCINSNCKDCVIN